MTRVAAIDCGTNSIRLLIADVTDGRLTDVVRTLEVVRLGQGVDETGRFADDALARTLAVTRRYAAECRQHGVERLRFVATSATRDAANRDDFLGPVREILGVEAEVIEGREEAELSFRGALSVLDAAGEIAAGPRAVAPGTAAVGSARPVAAPGTARSAAEPTTVEPASVEPTTVETASVEPDAGLRLVVDLGGGSTELVLGRSSPVAAFSMDVGCVRLTERHVRTDPPSAAERAGIEGDVRSAIEEAGRVVDLAAASVVLGVAGTVTTITAHALGLETYDPAAIDGARLPLDVVLAACDALAGMPRDARARLPYMHEGRVDVIPAGALIWAEVLRQVRDRTAHTDHPLTDVLTSEHDILDGVALALE